MLLPFPVILSAFILKYRGTCYCIKELIWIKIINTTKSFNATAIIVTPKRQLTAQKHIIRHISVKIGPPFFAQLTLLPNSRNPVLYNAFQSARHAVSLRMGTSTFPCNRCSLEPPNLTSQTSSRSVLPFLHSSWQRVPPYTLQSMCTV